MKIAILILFALFILFLLYGYASNFFLKIEDYELVSSGIEADTTIVLLTDLHNCEHGPGNRRLRQEIDTISPELVCIAGDMVVKGESAGTERKQDPGHVISFLSELAESYTVCYAPGNHETRMEGYEEYRQSLKKAGIQYLENETVTTEAGIAVTGLDLPAYWYHKCWEKRRFSEGVMEELLGPCREDRFHILLAHNPEYFPFYAAWGADLTLSGHVHGGIMRLPFAGGVIAPSLRLFPRYDAGLYEIEGRYMVLSRGLGLHHIRLRFFNRPELSRIRLKKPQNDNN